MSVAGAHLFAPLELRDGIARNRTVAARICELIGAPTQKAGLITEAAQANAIKRSGAAASAALGRESLRDLHWAGNASHPLGAADFAAWPRQYVW